ncbi:MAG: hypothetical protein E6Q40_07065 [Cupriavidus sp.]|nr:MAG: hypothetical protein E6Q40_07065 [Cupriavidus sp.]
MPPVTNRFIEPVAWVLAAGWGRRMGGRPKSAMRIHGLSVLEGLITALADGCKHVNVLVGPYADVLGPLALQAGAHVHMVSQPGGSILDSQADAIRLHLRGHPGRDMLITVADLPLLQAAHVQALLCAWHESPKVNALAPVVGAQRGHPVVLPSALAQKVSAEGHGHLRTWFQHHPASLATWEAADRAYVTDFDTPEDLDAVSAFVRHGPLPAAPEPP